MALSDGMRGKQWRWIGVLVLLTVLAPVALGACGSGASFSKRSYTPPRVHEEDRVTTTAVPNTATSTRTEAATTAAQGAEEHRQHQRDYELEQQYREAHPPLPRDPSCERYLRAEPEEDTVYIRRIRWPAGTISAGAQVFAEVCGHAPPGESAVFVVCEAIAEMVPYAPNATLQDNLGLGAVAHGELPEIARAIGCNS